jgi:hypothetical protein
MKKVEELNQGEVLLVAVKKINGGKFQLEFAEKISNPNARPGSIAGLLNESDDRFSNNLGSARRAWMSGTAEDIKAKLGVDTSDLAEVGDSKELGLLNPSIKGYPLHIQITETTEGSDYDVANFATRAKRAGKDGDFILSSEGEYIYVKSTVVQGPASHVFMTDTIRNAQAAGSADGIIDDATA